MHVVIITITFNDLVVRHALRTRFLVTLNKDQRACFNDKCSHKQRHQKYFELCFLTSLWHLLLTRRHCSLSEKSQIILRLFLERSFFTLPQSDRWNQNVFLEFWKQVAGKIVGLANGRRVYRVREDSIVSALRSSFVSSQVNSTLLEGNWGDPEDFEDGTAPWEWSGSIAILEQFWKEKDIVKYGQCWVFSGILTSCT